MKPGEIIRTIRIELDLSLREVARASGIPHVLLGEIERGRTETNPVQLASLCGVMAQLVEPRAKQRASVFRAKMESAVRR